MDDVVWPRFAGLRRMGRILLRKEGWGCAGQSCCVSTSRYLQPKTNGEAGDLEEIYFVIEKEEGFPIEEVKVSRGGSGKEKQMGASSPLLKRVIRLSPRMMLL